MNSVSLFYGFVCSRIRRINFSKNFGILKSVKEATKLLFAMPPTGTYSHQSKVYSRSELTSPATAHPAPNMYIE